MVFDKTRKLGLNRDQNRIRFRDPKWVLILAPNPGLQPVGRKLAKGLMVKLLRAHGGCLGIRKRRRAWLAAISFGEPQAGVDPEIPEWGNPMRQYLIILWVNT